MKRFENILCVLGPDGESEATLDQVVNALSRLLGSHRERHAKHRDCNKGCADMALHCPASGAATGTIINSGATCFCAIRSPCRNWLL